MNERLFGFAAWSLICLLPLAGLVLLAPGEMERGHLLMIGEARPIERARLEGGCFEMGEGAVYPEESPAVEVCVEGFELARREVTNAQFAEFVWETGYLTTAERAGGSWIFALDAEALPRANWWRFEPGVSWNAPSAGRGLTPGDALRPVVHVTAEDAEAYARWAGARLPSEAEWEFAARRGASDGASLERANTWQGLFPLHDAAEDGHAGTAPAASYAPDAAGLYDMIGNVWEITASTYYPSHRPGRSMTRRVEGFDPDQPGEPVRVLKGGSFLCSADFCMRFRPAARQAQARSLSTSHIGFRVARDTS
jgi:formylglycine-generating enzyme required for sulfatase activity